MPLRDGASGFAIAGPTIQLTNEIPLRFDVQVSSELVVALGIMSEPPPLGAAIASILANLLVAGWLGAEWLFYSRDNNHFASVRPVAPLWYARRTVVEAVALLAADGLLEERRTAPSPTARHRSRLRATPKLLAKAAGTTVSDLRWSQPPCVILRDREEGSVLEPSVALNATALAQLSEIARDVEEHNRFLSEYTISLGAEHAKALTSGLIKIEDVYLNPLQRASYRVFNGDLRHGGRWYGPWWQAVPSAIRPNLIINGEPAVELDYAACQLRLMLASRGVPDPLSNAIRQADPNRDLYRISGGTREEAKLAVLIAINAPDRRTAVAALAGKVSSVMGEARSQKTSLRRAQRILRAVQAHFPDLEPLWFTGIGLRMQRIDSDICAVVQQGMRACGLPVLSIHDAFITWQHAEPQLRRIMQDAFGSAYRRLQSQFNRDTGE